MLALHFGLDALVFAGAGGVEVVAGGMPLLVGLCDRCHRGVGVVLAVCVLGVAPVRGDHGADILPVAFGASHRVVVMH